MSQPSSPPKAVTAAEIKAAYAAHVANLKTAQNSAFKARNTEAEKLWNSYKRP